MTALDLVDDGRAAPDPRPDPVEALPGAIRALLVREGLAVVRVTEMTAVSGRSSARRTFRLDLEGGGAVKARLLPDEEVAARMSRWLPLLAPLGFSPLLAALGTVTLEGWIDGRPASRADEAMAEEAGALLGACHAVLRLEPLAPDDLRLRAFVAEVDGWLREVEASGHLDADHAGRVRAALRASPPTAATWGLRHGDFHPENLVVGKGGLCCVDSTTVGPGVIELDLGFTFNRWPLDPRQRERFLRGYGSRANPGRFLAHERHWRIAAALRSASWRTRHGAQDMDLPLSELRSHVP